MRKPFFWKQRNCWYVRSDDGRTNIRLDPDESKAYDVWEELRTAQHPESPAAPYAVIAENYLSHAEKTLGAKAYRASKDYLVSACNVFGMVRVLDLKKHHVIKWLDDKPTWGDWARRGAAGAVQRSLNWALDQGYIKVNPLVKLGLPKGGRREALISDATHAAMIANVDEGRQPGERIAKLGRRPVRRDTCFRPVLIALRHSGTRPGMVAAVKVENVTPKVDAWIMREHKTRKKTKRPLIVQLSPCLQTLTRILMAGRTEGPLLINSRGVAWTSNAIRCRMKNLQDKLGLPEGTVAYAYRHSWTTTAILNGVDIATIATMLGHKDLRMLMEHYAHLEQQPQHLLDAAAKAVQRRA
jgi:integrase